MNHSIHWINAIKIISILLAFTFAISLTLVVFALLTQFGFSAAPKLLLAIEVHPKIVSALVLALLLGAIALGQFRKNRAI